jgi:outer membrane protein
MKNLILACICLFNFGVLSAQKYAFVDTKYILENVPEYREAQKDLDSYSMQWQKEIEQRYETIDKLKKALLAERVLLTEDMIKTRESEIAQKEADARDLQRQRFGVNGDLFKRRQELIQPIQDNIYTAIKEVAEGSGYMVIFDKGMNTNILYGSPKYDKSDRVLRKMGYRPGERGGTSADDDGDDAPQQDQQARPDEKPGMDRMQQQQSPRNQQMNTPPPSGGKR